MAITGFIVARFGIDAPPAPSNLSRIGQRLAPLAAYKPTVGERVNRRSEPIEFMIDVGRFFYLVVKGIVGLFRWVSR
ncbi:MAG: hypothetical protein ABW069_21825 [Duganella sp.]